MTPEQQLAFIWALDWAMLAHGHLTTVIKLELQRNYSPELLAIHEKLILGEISVARAFVTLRTLLDLPRWEDDIEGLPLWKSTAEEYEEEPEGDPEQVLSKAPEK